MVSERVPTASELDSRLKAAEAENAQLRAVVELASGIAARMEKRVGRMERRSPAFRGGEWIDEQRRMIERRKARRG